MNPPEKMVKNEEGQRLSVPSISLPKGGGAIRGMGEKFAANPVTGTGSMTVPITTSPGRSGFGPQLSLSYDSGAGNGPFGFGWSLSIPSITRKTDKGLPLYNDVEESDVFLLSGSDDLVPEIKKDNLGQWVMLNGEHVLYEETRTVNGVAYTVRRYRPRIEGLFARIERWTQTDGDVHWRSISKDNILTIYGRDDNSRIVDPDDSKHIFSWLICETRDDKGNAITYEYKPEDSINTDLSQAHERNRGGRDDKRRKVNRYLKRVKYGNRVPLLDVMGHRPQLLTKTQTDSADWMFEVIFDYDDHDPSSPKPKDDEAKDDVGVLKYPWKSRQDPFSSYRSGFEIRTYRLCQRVLMFHHFPNEDSVGADCLVRSTDFDYSYEQNPNDVRNPIYSFLLSVTQTGYKRSNGGYLKRSLPPVEFKYTQPTVQDTVEEVDSVSLENLPIGVDGASYLWTDLHGEGIPGILTEQGGAWFYKRNLSPLPIRNIGSETVKVRLAPVELVASKPNLDLEGGQAQFMDLAGDGQPDLVVLEGPTPGLYEHDGNESWLPFRPFTSRLSRDTQDPNLKFVDLNGDGHADVLITEDDAFIWHPSLAEEGFGSAYRVTQALDEEKGPRLVFADGTQSIYLADLSGDGLTDLARIRNGEVCYWPNLGYGRFGAKVTMDHAPQFDRPDQFDQNRIRLADIDGSGTTDLIYLHRDGVRLYFNQSGNGWSEPQILRIFPRVDDIVSITPTDLLGNGTACLVWSSPLPGDTRRPMRYVNLMGRDKPHLLVNSVNNLGAETRVHYAPSTQFYLQDKRDGRPWITRLPFPVHVVERVETYDRVSGNRFVARYEYHNGYFDGEEREFRGFGMVEQWDTEEIGTIPTDQQTSTDTNLHAASLVPPVLTRTWFHTGIFLDREHISRLFAGLWDGKDRGEYYREPAWLEDDEEANKRLLPDTLLPEGLSLEEEREACRALKGTMLRQEIYALDGVGKEEDYPYGHPYSVTEQNATVHRLQPRSGDRYAVFFTHPSEMITYHYEREPNDPRIQHALTLEVDAFGNTLKEAAIGYGRRQSPLDSSWDREKQTTTLYTYTENLFTNSIDDPNIYRTPLPAESRTYELTGYPPTGAAGRFRHDDFVQPDPNDPTRWEHIHEGETEYEDVAPAGKQRRLLEHIRTLYRKDDLSSLLPLGEVQPLAFPGENYKLAFTPGLLAKVFRRDGQPLLPNPADVLGGQGADKGGYVVSQDLKAAGVFPNTDPDGHWWIPAGRVFYSPGANDDAATELAFARQHFFLPHRYRDPWDHTTFITYDSHSLHPQRNHNLLVVGTEDAVGNRVTAQNDYRVLQPWQITDPNGNRSEVRFDALGLVVGTAVMGKAGSPSVAGDSFAQFTTDLTSTQIQDYFDAANPRPLAIAHLGTATTRILYDLDRIPACAATIARETHVSDLQGQPTHVQLSFSYSDGFAREMQRKVQAEPGPVPQRGADGLIILGAEGQPVMTPNPVSPRWVGSGWTVFNNKGKPVRQFEPFFSDTHKLDRDVRIGVSPWLFYDPVERVVATLHPNHTWEKVVFDPWQQSTYDVNDTVLHEDGTTDPRLDPDVQGFLKRLPEEEYLPTWYEQRSILAANHPERVAAEKAAIHRQTPTIAHFDTLGRPFLTIAHNRFARNGAIQEEEYSTRVELDIEGNQRVVRDALVQNGDGLGRMVMRYDYSMVGPQKDENGEVTNTNNIHQASMEAGERWMLNDAADQSLRAWDSRGHEFRTTYDPIRRPLLYSVIGMDLNNPNQELMTERLVYGEQHPQAEQRNLRGHLHLHLDQAGASSSEAFDYKGNPLRTLRRIAVEYKQAIDWSPVDAALPTSVTLPFNPAALEAALTPLLDTATYTSRTTYDALNRPVQMIAPLSDQPGAKRNVLQPGYNEANLPERVDVWLDHAAEPAGLIDANVTPPAAVGVSNIDYDAKGQRLRIDYKNGTTTHYRYDPQTFRLSHLYTRRGASFTEDCGGNPPPPRFAAPDDPPANTPCGLQNLHYTYDPVGNITNIRDDAQQTLYFRNRIVEPSAEYTYDAIYRLIEATGREHLGQVGGVPNPPTPHSHNDASRVGVLSANAAENFSPNDGNAMGTYRERYVYDAVGNFLSMRHIGSDPAHSGWTRTYAYNETSQIEDGNAGTQIKTSNRLSSTTIGNGTPTTHHYVHDAHGNMIRMPHLGGAHPTPNLHWDYKDQLHQADLGGGGTAYYTYDAAGQRVRKVWENSANLIEERIYLGGFEIYRRRQGAARLERETLHIMDDTQRIALVETRTLDTAGTDLAPQQLIRYQHSNHLGSASLELDEQAQIITYEEYTPYGSTAYQAVRKQTETPKRYRYTSMERDEESGLCYHGARYYAPWLGRWTSTDPIGVAGGKNLYAYVANNPVILADPNGTDPEPSKQPLPQKPETPKFVAPTIPNFKDKPSRETITWGGHSVDVYLFPGKSKETFLILGGVHQDEKNALKLSNELLARLQGQKDKPFYNIVFIPDLFHGLTIDPGTHGDIEGTPTNRNFPAPDQSLADSVKKGKPKDEQNRNILPGNVILMAVVEKFLPSASLSIHSSRSKKESEIDTKGAASITVDPKPGDEAKADLLTAEAALAAQKAGVPVPGNRVDQAKETARTRYPNSTAPAARGVTFGNWGSHRGGMNQYLIETEGYTTPKGRKNNYSGWIPIIQDKILADPADVAAEKLIRNWTPFWNTLKQAYGF